MILFNLLGVLFLPGKTCWKSYIYIRICQLCICVCMHLCMYMNLFIQMQVSTTADAVCTLTAEKCMYELCIVWAYMHALISIQCPALWNASLLVSDGSFSSVSSFSANAWLPHYFRLVLGHCAGRASDELAVEWHLISFQLQYIT